MHAVSRRRIAIVEVGPDLDWLARATEKETGSLEPAPKCSEPVQEALLECFGEIKFEKGFATSCRK